MIGKLESLPDALARVLARTDNQDKLAAVDADARHLYLLLRDHAAASGLMGIWPLRECPPDPRGVLDALWVFAPSASGFLHRVVPGTNDWEHYVMATGEQVRGREKRQNRGGWLEPSQTPSPCSDVRRTAAPVLAFLCS